MLVWIKRFRVDKEHNHITFVDLFYDSETKVEYYGYGDKCLIPRLDAEGKPVLYK